MLLNVLEKTQCLFQVSKHTSWGDPRKWNSHNSLLKPLSHGGVETLFPMGSQFQGGTLQRHFWLLDLKGED